MLAQIMSETRGTACFYKEKPHRSAGGQDHVIKPLAED